MLTPYSPYQGDNLMRKPVTYNMLSCLHSLSFWCFEVSLMSWHSVSPTCEYDINLSSGSILSFRSGSIVVNVRIEFHHFISVSDIMETHVMVTSIHYVWERSRCIGLTGNQYQHWNYSITTDGKLYENVQHFKCVVISVEYNKVKGPLPHLI